MSKRGPYIIRWRARGAGRDGGLGPTKSFRTNASCPKNAAKKLRGNGVIISVRKASNGDN